jgi:hypothetical protein
MDVFRDEADREVYLEYLSEHLGLAEKDPLVKDRTLMGLVPEGGWGELLREVDEEARDHVRMATRTGRPAGDGKFLGRMERKTGRELAPYRGGRPMKRRRQ